jgi:hypothetical protein
VRRDGRSIISPQFMGSPKMALFIAERAYDLFLAPHLAVSTLASLGLPCGHRLLWIRLGLSFLFPLLAEMLIPFHGAKTGDPKLFPQGC